MPSLSRASLVLRAKIIKPLYFADLGKHIKSSTKDDITADDAFKKCAPPKKKSLKVRKSQNTSAFFVTVF